MNDQFKKDVQKSIKSQNIGELTPGTTPRRYEPIEGTNNLNKRIHRESSYVDKHSNLPFSFSKPTKPAKPAAKICNNCEAYVHVTKNTIGVICPSCKTYSSVREVAIEEEK